jgi:AcrR family transcriptional regulator
MPSDAAVSRRTGGRSAVVLSAVRRAVEELVREHGSERVSIPMVAERAAVNPSSLYRKWGDISTLVNEVASYRLDPDRPLPDTGTVDEDLAEWAKELARHFSKPANASLLRAGAALAGDGDSDCTVRRRREAAVLVARAEGRAESSPTVEQVVNHVVAPITYRAIFTPSDLTDETVAGLIADLRRASYVPAVRP